MPLCWFYHAAAHLLCYCLKQIVQTGLLVVSISSVGITMHNPFTPRGFFYPVGLLVVSMSSVGISMHNPFTSKGLFCLAGLLVVSMSSVG